MQNVIGRIYICILFGCLHKRDILQVQLRYFGKYISGLGIDMGNRENRERDDREKRTAKRSDQSIEIRRAEARRQRRKRVERQRRILVLILLFVLVGIVFAAVIFFRNKDDAVQKYNAPDEQSNLQNRGDSGKQINILQERGTSDIDLFHDTGASDTGLFHDTGASDTGLFHDTGASGTDLFHDTGANETDMRQETETNAIDSGELLLELSEADKYTGDLILVNANYRYHVEENQELVQLVRVADVKKGNYTVSGPEVQLAGRVMEPLERMIAACEAETGSYLSGISSAYRSVEDQQALYEEYADLYDLEYARAYVANPGYSEHHTGLAMDLSIFYEDGSEGTFSSSAEAEWYADNSYRFGFVLRYQASKTEITGISNEEWHFRYVGIPHAYYMYEHDLCLEEYVDWLRSNTSELEPITQACGDETYEIFFTANTSVSLPAKSEYLVSGNNVDGYVIAYKRK